MNFNSVLNQMPRPIALGLVVIMIVSAFLTTAEANSPRPKYAKKNDAVRKSNKNYSNACELLLKKRMARIKPSKSKRKMSKWR
jgi:hypothetical protein